LIITKTASAQQVQLVNLLCDYRNNPIGVSASNPVFSWQLQSAQYNVKQQSYQILVSDDSIALVKGSANMWNSSLIISDTSIQHAYQGKPLQAAKKYYWKVHVRDNKNNSVSSKIHSWQMGLLQASDWLGAKWIPYEAIPDKNKIAPLVHLNGKKAWGKRPDILPLFRKEFTATKKIKSETTPNDGIRHYELYRNGKRKR